MQFYYLKDETGADLPDTEGVKLVEESGQVWSVPCHEGNRHWRMYQAWLAEGNTTQTEA